MSKIILTQLQQDVLSFFGQHPFGKNFYWTGGILLAYQYLNHRWSQDLDFFSDDLFSNDQYLTLINELKKKLSLNKVTMVLRHNKKIRP